MVTRMLPIIKFACETREIETVLWIGYICAIQLLF